MRIVNTMRIGKKLRGASPVLFRVPFFYYYYAKSPAPVTLKITYISEIRRKISCQLTLQPNAFFPTKSQKKYVCENISWKWQKKKNVFVGLISSCFLQGCIPSLPPKVTGAGELHV